MRWRGVAGLLLAVAFGAVAGTGAASGSDPAPAVTGPVPEALAPKPRLTVGPLYPLTVRGVRFKPRELVTVWVAGQASGTKKVHADRRGTFSVGFAIRVARCGTVRIRASGLAGSRATFQIPRPDCREP